MISESIAKGVGPHGLDLAFESRGHEQHPTVVLIMGIAAQMVHWPLGFLDALVAKNLRVVRFDNRDAGRSTHLVQAPPVNFAAAMKGDFSSAAYSLSHMAADTVGLLDRLKVAKAHVVGASMGAAIAQTIAVEYPRRVLSLTSMMFTTGHPAVGQTHPETLKTVFGAPPATTRQEAMELAVRASKVTGSPRYPVEEKIIAETAGLAWDRDHDAAAVTRQAVATLASGDRTDKLRGLNLPTLVLHGLADTVVDPSGGRATAEAIPGAKLVLIEGMGHNLPPGLWETVADHIADVVRKGEAAGGE